MPYPLWARKAQLSTLHKTANYFLTHNRFIQENALVEEFVISAFLIRPTQHYYLQREVMYSQIAPDFGQIRMDIAERLIHNNEFQNIIEVKRFSAGQAYQNTIQEDLVRLANAKFVSPLLGCFFTIFVQPNENGWPGWYFLGANNERGFNGPHIPVNHHFAIQNDNIQFDIISVFFHEINGADQIGPGAIEYQFQTCTFEVVNVGPVNNTQ